MDCGEGETEFVDCVEAGGVAECEGVEMVGGFWSLGWEDFHFFCGGWRGGGDEDEEFVVDVTA